jgi:hypothetical protein
MGPLLRRQTKALAKYSDDFAHYEQALLDYNVVLKTWMTKGTKCGEPQPQKPGEPFAERSLVADTTIEALVAVLEHQPRGVLMSRDELSGWFGSFDRYSGKRGGDVAHWLSMHRAGPVTQDRKTNKRLIQIRRAAVSVTGTIQPEALRRSLAQEHIDDGLASRFLFAYPPKRRRQWTEATVPDVIEAAVENVFDRLLSLQFAEEPKATGDGDQTDPINLDLDEQAKTAFIAFVNAHGDEQYELTGALKSAWSKLEGYGARLALVVHLLRWAAQEPSVGVAGPIDLTSIQAGITLAKWFGQEARRVYALLGETDEQRSRRELVEIIQRHGNRASCRDVMRNHQAADAEAGDEALQDLVTRGYGSWESVPSGPKGGRPTRVFRLSDQYAADTTAKKPRADGVSSHAEIEGVKEEWEEGIV